MSNDDEPLSYARRHPKDAQVMSRLRELVDPSRVVDAIGRWQGPGRWAERDALQIHGLVVHQSFGSGSVEALARYHTGENHISPTGLPGPAYWAYIDRPTERQLRAGALPTLWILNSLADRTWSHGYGGLPGDENALFAGICVGGSFKPAGPDDPMPEQTALLMACWRALVDVYKWTPATWFTHADLGKPECPGAALQAIVETHREPYRVMAQERFALDRSEAANRNWQEALFELGYYRGPIDGIWGSKSVDALLQWRRVKRLNMVKRSTGAAISRWILDQWVLFADIKAHRQALAS